MPKRSIAYLKGRKCCRCGSGETKVKGLDFEGRKIYHWYSCSCDIKGCAKYLCYSCWHKNYDKNNPISTNNICKLYADWRNGNLDPESNNGKGFAIEMVVAKVRNLGNCNLELDNFLVKFDLSVDSEYGRPQVKGPTFDAERRRWKANLDVEHNFDHVWIVCMDKDRKHIQRVYIVPESELYGETYLYVYEYWPKLRRSKFEWIEKYRVDEKPYDNVYHNMKLEDCKVLRKDK